MHSFNKYLLSIYLVLPDAISEVTEDDEDVILGSQSSKMQIARCDADGERLLETHLPPLFIQHTPVRPLAVCSSHLFWEAACDLSPESNPPCYRLSKNHVTFLFRTCCRSSFLFLP